MLSGGDYQASGEKSKSDSTFPGDSSASQPSDTSILLHRGFANDTSDRGIRRKYPKFGCSEPYAIDILLDRSIPTLPKY
jgi:hypothetical protein